MLFNSYIFIFLFLPITLCLFYYAIGKSNQFAKIALVSCSLVFYTWWNPGNLPILLSSIVVNYFLGEALKRGASQRLLVIGISLNLIYLGIFKYTNFILQNVSLLQGALFEPLNIVLPLAISFFTFQQIAYLVDCKRGLVGKNSVYDYLLFVTFFPQLIAGPIVHHREMMPQFSQLKRNGFAERLGLGTFIFAIGLFKKCFIADNFAIWANAGFSYNDSLSFFEAWFTSLSYTFQLYFDFSGYVDMATGCALMFGIRLPVNFNSPYKSSNIQDFWRRWHITLGRFLRDYLYIPLGGSRATAYKTYINLTITFGLAGLWHGASWMFVIWGLLHAFALIIHRIWQYTGVSLPKVIAWLITFNFVNLTWIFFRAEDLDQAYRIIRGMLGLEGIVWPLFLNRLFAGTSLNTGDWLAALTGNILTVIAVFLALTICLTAKNSNQFAVDWRPSRGWAAASAVLLVIGIASLAVESPFLYFNF
ncbi:MAG: MBOAT family O-acyltransferase [Alishewanella aestuarii]